jgi:hypothetical protein
MAVFLESKRKKMIAFNNYKYNFGSVNITTGSIRWRCVKRNRTANIHN